VTRLEEGEPGGAVRGGVHDLDIQHHRQQISDERAYSRVIVDHERAETTGVSHLEVRRTVLRGDRLGRAAWHPLPASLQSRTASGESRHAGEVHHHWREGLGRLHHQPPDE
jgi:hypothetical protein